LRHLDERVDSKLIHAATIAGMVGPDRTVNGPPAAPASDPGATTQSSSKLTRRQSSGIRHAQLDGSTANGRLAHRRELLCRGGDGGLDRGDLAELALFLGFLEPVDEVGVDSLQPRDLGRVDPE
jgi:hypothetical protein